MQFLFGKIKREASECEELTEWQEREEKKEIADEPSRGGQSNEDSSNISLNFTGNQSHWAVFWLLV